MNSFSAWVVQKEAGRATSEFTDLFEHDLPKGEVLIRVAYSSLNYKDGLILTGDRTGLVKSYPMVPGIDFSGTVVRSESGEFAPGDQVIATGWGLGESRWGGYAQMARVPASCLVPLPSGLSLKHAMTLGTAGLTAVMSVEALRLHGVTPDSGPVLVSGAAGGVGSLCVLLLQREGYEVCAWVRDEAQRDYLKSMSTADVQCIASEAAAAGEVPNGQWNGAIDCIGGPLLAFIVSQVRNYGSVAAVGTAAGPVCTLALSDFVARGVNLLGIYSVMLPRNQRIPLWDRLAILSRSAELDSITTVISLPDLIPMSKKIVQGEVRGRVVVEVDGSP